MTVLRTPSGGSSKRVRSTEEQARQVEKDRWRTPRALFEALDLVYRFSRDIASEDSDCLLCFTHVRPCGLPHYPAFDALRDDWGTVHPTQQRRLVVEEPVGVDLDDEAPTGVFPVPPGPWFLNPPYAPMGRGMDPQSSLLTWARRALHQSQMFHRQVVMVLPVDPSTEWWQLLMRSCSRMWTLQERVRFLRPDGTVGAAPRGATAVFELGPEPDLRAWKGWRMR